VQAFVEQADADEERAGGDAVVDHHQHRALDALGVEAKMPRVAKPMWPTLE
jgi:hypothetical protein